MNTRIENSESGFCSDIIIDDDVDMVANADEIQPQPQQDLHQVWELAKLNWDLELDEENMPCTTKDEVRRETLLTKIKSWASNHTITHMAIGDLMKVLNEEIVNINLPIDGRTVMETPRQVNIVNDSALGGSYWHYGLQTALYNALVNENTTNGMTVNLTINIDGLPLYKSSKMEFWPILVSIFEFDAIQPLIIGIYCGRGMISFDTFCHCFVLFICSIFIFYLYFLFLFNINIR